MSSTNLPVAYVGPAWWWGWRIFCGIKTKAGFQGLRRGTHQGGGEGVWINARIPFQRASRVWVLSPSVIWWVIVWLSSLYTQEESLLPLLLTSSLHPSPRSLLPLSSWLRSTDNLYLKDNGWLAGWMDDGCADGKSIWWMDRWMDDRWTAGWMERWIDGWMNQRTKKSQQNLRDP